MRVIALLVLWGCKDGGVETDTTAGCEECVGSELCVLHRDADETDVFTACIALPAECGDGLDCTDNTCVRDAYAGCEVGYVGGSCSEDETPALICYADTP